MFLRKFLTPWPKGFSIFFLSAILLFASLRASAGEDSERLYFFQAMKLKQEGRFLTAERLLQKAVEREPQNPDYHFELGNLYVERQNLEEASREFEQALMISPRHLAAHYNLGLVYRELGGTAEARDEFQKVLELDPGNVKAQLQIGYSYQAEGFFEEAQQAFETAHAMDVTDPEPEQALEDLAESERQAQTQSKTANERSLFANQQFLGERGQVTPSTPPSGREALVQAGSLLLQEFFARRAQARSSNENSRNSS